MSDFLEYRECQHCREMFPIRSPRARKAKYCSEACRKAKYTEPLPCPDCGGPTSASRRNGMHRVTRCIDCENGDRALARAVVDNEVAELRRQGYLNHQIAAMLGTTAPAIAARIHRMRKEGIEVARTTYAPTVARSAA